MYRKNIIYIGLFIIFTLVACEKEVSVSQPVPEEPMGDFIISSYPENSKIFIDGRNSGYTTPYTIKYLEIKEHNVTLKLDLFKDYDFTITPNEETLESYNADYRTLPGVNGSLKVYADKKATNIQFDNKHLTINGPTVVTNIFPGYYKVKAVKDDHRTDSTIVTIRSGQETYASLSLEDTTIWVSYSQNNSDIPYNYVKKIVVDNSKNKWMATDGGLIKFTGKTFEIYNKENSPLLSNNIYSLLIDKHNNLWVGTGNGLVKFDGINWEVYIKSNSDIIDNLITALAEGPDGSIWIGTNNGLSQLKNNIWFQFNHRNAGFLTNFITAVAVNDENIVLAGTSGFGFYQFKNNLWTRFDSRMPLDPSSVGKPPGSVVASIACDKDNNFWISMAPSEGLNQPGGLTVYDDDLGFFMKIEGRFKFFMRDIYIDENNNKWISSSIGLYHFDAENQMHLYTDMLFDNTTSFYPEQNDVFWISTEGDGVVKWKY